MKQGLKLGAICLGLFALVALAMSIGCSSQACTTAPASEHEARRALAAFFRSEAGASHRLVARLRRDGLKDEYLTKLQDGCSTDCYVFLGKDESVCVGCYVFQPPPTNKPAWHAIAPLGPPEDKKLLDLQIDCAEDVWIASTMYGG